MGRDAPISDLWPIQFKPSVDVSAFGVMEGTGATTNHGEVVVTTKQYVAGDPRKVIYVNGPADVTAYAYGRCSTAMHRPVMVLTNTTQIDGASIGPSDSSWECNAGHPGFTVVGASPITDTALVMRQPEMTRCQGLAVSNTETTDSTFSVDTVHAYSGLEPVASTTATLTVRNKFEDEITADDPLTFSWDRTDNEWKTDDAMCP